MADDAETTIHDEIQAQLEERLDGSLPAAEAARVADHLAGCDECRAAEAEIVAMRAALGTLGKQGAPEAFREQVTDTIHRRSAGRFFARRTLGDRVPFGILLVVALIVLGAVAALLWSSSTGSLRVDPPASAPAGDPPRVVTPP
jgi:anti-sigma factor RsiW